MQVGELFDNFDKAMDALQTYSAMIEGLGCNIEVEDDKLRSKRKKDIKNIKDCLCNRFVNENIPRAFAQVVS